MLMDILNSSASYLIIRDSAFHKPNQLYVSRRGQRHLTGTFLIQNPNISKTQQDIKKHKTQPDLGWKSCHVGFNIGSTIFFVAVALLR